MNQSNGALEHSTKSLLTGSTVSVWVSVSGAAAAGPSDRAVCTATATGVPPTVGR